MEKYSNKTVISIDFERLQKQKAKRLNDLKVQREKLLQKF